MILTEKLQKYYNYHQVKLKYEYFTGEEILPTVQKKVNFHYFLSRKTFEKQTIEDVAEKQVKNTDQKSIPNFFSKNFLCKETIYQLSKLKK